MPSARAFRSNLRFATITATIPIAKRQSTEKNTEKNKEKTGIIEEIEDRQRTHLRCGITPQPPGNRGTWGDIMKTKTERKRNNPKKWVTVKAPPFPKRWSQKDNNKLLMQQQR